MSECVVEPVPSIEPCPTTTDGVSVGDKLRCKDSSFSALELRIGEWHTVAYVDPHSTRVCVTGSTVRWKLSRFDKIIRVLRPPAVVAEPNPYADWNPGDSLRCLDASESGEFLADKHVYEIEVGPFVKFDRYRVRLVGLPKHEWNCERFERVAPIVDVHSEPDKPVVRVGSRVRCDDAKGFASSYLTVGRVYEVGELRQLTDGAAICIKGCDAPWLLSRFTLLPDEVAPVVPAKQVDQWDEATRGKKMSSATGRVIYKYQMPVMEHFTMQLPAGAEIIRMAGIDGMFWLWAVVDTNAPDEARKFHAVKCGGNMPDIANLKYVGCCAVFVQQELMLYIFEEVSNA